MSGFIRLHPHLRSRHGHGQLDLDVLLIIAELLSDGVVHVTTRIAAMGNAHSILCKFLIWGSAVAVLSSILITVIFLAEDAFFCVLCTLHTKWERGGSRQVESSLLFPNDRTGLLNRCAWLIFSCHFLCLTTPCQRSHKHCGIERPKGLFGFKVHCNIRAMLCHRWN
jgi:hypothetical protein